MKYWEHSHVLRAVRFLRVSWKSAILQKKTSVKSTREMFFPLQTLEMPASIATWVGSKATWAVFILMTADAGCYRRQQEGPSSLWQWTSQGAEEQNYHEWEHHREVKKMQGTCPQKNQNHFFFLNVIYQMSSNWLMATERNNSEFCCH